MNRQQRTNNRPNNHSNNQRSDRRSHYNSNSRNTDHLIPGDIIFARIPFEENTPDYYNGHKPEDIRQAPFANRRGESGKGRVVVYMGRDKDNILYLPITSSIGNASDAFHQYKLKDTAVSIRQAVTPIHILRWIH